MYRNPGWLWPKVSPDYGIKNKYKKNRKKKIVKKRYLTLNVTLVAPLQKKIVARSYGTAIDRHASLID